MTRARRSPGCDPAALRRNSTGHQVFPTAPPRGGGAPDSRGYARIALDSGTPGDECLSGTLSRASRSRVPSPHPGRGH
jgi:hypothetical protein